MLVLPEPRDPVVSAVSTDESETFFSRAGAFGEGRAMPLTSPGAPPASCTARRAASETPATVPAPDSTLERDGGDAKCGTMPSVPSGARLEVMSGLGAETDADEAVLEVVPA